VRREEEKDEDEEDEEEGMKPGADARMFIAALRA
jgi:hypothetical protein